MSAVQFRTLTRALDPHSRRRVLGILSGGVAISPLTLLADAEAKKRKHKKKCKKKSEQACPVCPSPPPPPPPPVPTCSETCPNACTYCFMRPAAPTMCGDGGGVVGCIEPCSSDNDCPPERPFCVSQIISRATGAPSPYCVATPPSGPICMEIRQCE